MADASAVAGMGLSFGGTYLQHTLNQQAAEDAYYRQRELLQMEQNFAQKQIDRQYNYNDLKAQMQRLRENGLNPNLVYGEGVQMAAPSAVSAPGAPTVQMAPTVDVAAMLLSGANAVKAIADAKRSNADTAGRVLENQYLTATMKERIDQVAVQNSWTKEQTVKASQEIAYMVGQCNSLQVEIDNLRKQGKLTDKQIDWYGREMSAKINEMKASAEYSRAAAALSKTQKEQMDALFDDVKRLTGSQADLAEKTVSLLDKYGDAQAIIGMVTQVLSAAADLIKFKIPGLK